MRAWLIGVVFVLGCGTAAPLVGVDGGSDAGATVDAGSVDAGHDAGQSADAGPSCECSSGPCCDGCHVRDWGFVAEVGIVVETYCSTAAACGAGIREASQSLVDHVCTGFGPNSYTNENDRVVTADCQNPSGTYLPHGRCSPIGGAHCVDGPTCGSVYP